MTALTKARNTPQKEGDVFAFNVAQNTKGFAGSIVFISDGNAHPAVLGLGYVVVGRAEHDYDNSGGNSGDIQVRVRRGIFKFSNHASDAIERESIGTDCYIVDDQTVAATSGSNTRSRAGIVTAIDTDGVWVAMGIGY